MVFGKVYPLGFFIEHNPYELCTKIHPRCAISNRLIVLILWFYYMMPVNGDITVITIQCEKGLYIYAVWST